MSPNPAQTIMSRLEEIQREFFSSLHLPLRGTSRQSTELPESDEPHAEAFFEVADRLIKPGPTMTSAERLELYHRQYWFRLLDSIAEDFPGLQKLLGHSRFWSLLEDYLLDRPSTSYTLRHLGEGLADFIQEWDGATDKERPWLYSLAMLEYAAMMAYERRELPPLSPEQLTTTELILQPHVVLLKVPAPADACAEWSEFKTPPLPESPVDFAIWRGPDRSVHQTKIASAEHELLRRLALGGALASIFEQPLNPEPTTDEVGNWFASWQQRGWLAARGSEADTVDFVRPVDPAMAEHGVDKMGSQARAMD